MAAGTREQQSRYGPFVLRRYWFEFDLRDHAPKPQTDALDCGTVQYAWLSRGAGVTGHDPIDCLELLRDLVGDELPAVARELPDVAVDHAALGIDRMSVGNPTWRGVWWPPVNLRGPSA